MKIINYNYGYTPASKGSEYYRGKILMSLDEYIKAKKYLMRCKDSTYFSKERLWQDLQNNIASVRGGGFHVVIRVGATEKIVVKYNLKGYKRQNYFVHVVPE